MALALSAGTRGRASVCHGRSVRPSDREMEEETETNGNLWDYMIVAFMASVLLGSSCGRCYCLLVSVGAYKESLVM